MARSNDYPRVGRELASAMPMARATTRERTNSDVRSFVFDRDKSRCVYCGQPAKQCDHVIPTKLNGPSVTSNLVATCRSCNIQKRGNLPTGMIVTALRHLINTGENVGWMYDYGNRVQILRQRLLSAENLAAFLFGALPERVVEGSLPRRKRGSESGPQDASEIEIGGDANEPAARKATGAKGVVPGE